MITESFSTLTESFLSNLTLFSALDEDEFKIVSDSLKVIHLKSGESVFKQGDTGKEMYIFYSGAMTAYAEQADGSQKKLFNITVGDFFGEMSIITHEPRSVTIAAAEDSVLIVFKEEDFYRIISEHPGTGFKILRTISVVQNRWLDQTSKSFSDLIRWGETARKRAITDEMTGLYNRRFLEESIKERFNDPSMSLRVMSLLMMDLDKIHYINDHHGAKGGDLIIISCANIISSSLRPGDIAARLSGDEFSVLLPDTDVKSAVEVAERIRAAIEEKKVEVPASPKPNETETTLISTRTSIGIAIAPLHARTLEDIMETSDEALRKAKELGRNRVEVFG